LQKGRTSRKPAGTAQKYLALAAMQAHIVAVRHDLPHMPSLGVSSLDSGRRGDMAASFFLGS
jgi:hypothetical protein